MKVNYLMRSLMFVPAHNSRLMDSASKGEADVLLLDVEDSCQPFENKQVARDNIVKYIYAGKFNKSKVFPRINDRESGELLKDVMQLTIDGVEGFMYPKSKKGEDIYFFGKLLETIEYQKGFPIGMFKIIPLIETTAAVLNVQEICAACPERVVAIAFGCEDFITDLGGVHKVCATFHYQDIDNNTVEGLGYNVFPEYRGRGLGWVMMEKVNMFCRALGYKYRLSKVAETNVASIKNLEKSGAKFTGKIEYRELLALNRVEKYLIYIKEL